MGALCFKPPGRRMVPALPNIAPARSSSKTSFQTFVKFCMSSWSEIQGNMLSVEICWEVTFLFCLLRYFTMKCQLVMLCTIEWNAVWPYSSGADSSGRGNTDLFLGAFPKLRKATISFVVSGPSVRPHGTTRLALDGFSWNLIFEFFFRKLSRKFKCH
jgi:hypothetical protein